MAAMFTVFVAANNLLIILVAISLRGILLDIILPIMVISLNRNEVHHGGDPHGYRACQNAIDHLKGKIASLWRVCARPQSSEDSLKMRDDNR